MLDLGPAWYLCHVLFYLAKQKVEASCLDPIPVYFDFRANKVCLAAREPKWLARAGKGLVVCVTSEANWATFPSSPLVSGELIN